MTITSHTSTWHLGRRVLGAVATLLAAIVLLGHAANASAMGPTQQTNVVDVINTEYPDLVRYWAALGGGRPPVGYYNYRDSYGRIVDYYNVPAQCVTDRSGNTVHMHGSQGFYCAANDTIYMDYTQLTQEIATYGDGAIGFWLAHEYGHHVENYSQTMNRAAPNLELLADCYAGVFFQYDRALGHLFWNDYLEARNQIWALSWSDPQHGTPSQRLASFDFGFNHTWQNCANAYR